MSGTDPCDVKPFVCFWFCLSAENQRKLKPAVFSAELRALSARQTARCPGCCSYLGVLLVVVLLGADPAAHQVVPDGVRQGEVVVPGSRHVPVLHHSEVKVSVEAPLDLRNISEPRNAPHADLLPLLLVAQRHRHVPTPGEEARGPGRAGRGARGEPTHLSAGRAGTARGHAHWKQLGRSGGAGAWMGRGRGQRRNVEQRA